jgi:hypothetical protein|tara:strand:+ start:261 stop:422 length:162 start_codon:yes stop_codon:yes gene_type:complete
MLVALVPTPTVNLVVVAAALAMVEQMHQIHQIVEVLVVLAFNFLQHLEILHQQ